MGTAKRANLSTSRYFPPRTLLGLRALIATYSVLAGQDEHLVLSRLLLIAAETATLVGLLTFIEHLPHRRVRFFLRLLVIGCCAAVGASNGEHRPDSRSGVFLSLVVVFDQCWESGILGGSLFAPLTAVLTAGAANSLFRSVGGNSPAYGQFVWPLLGLVAYRIAGQRRREAHLHMQHVSEERSFLQEYAQAIGRQQVDLQFHDLKAVAQIMGSNGSESARRLLAEEGDSFAVLTTAPQLGIVPLAEVVGPIVDPPQAWAFPLTEQRRLRLRQLLDGRERTDTVRVANYASVISDPSLPLTIELDGDIHSLGRPMERQRFRLEPDVFVFVLAAFWTATELAVPLPTWLRVFQLAAVVLALLAAIETQRVGVAERGRAVTACRMLCALEFTWIGLRLLYSVDHPSFPPSVTVAALLVGVARFSRYLTEPRDRVWLACVTVIALALLFNPQWAWYAASRILEFWTAVTPGLVAFLMAHGVARSRTDAERAHDEDLTSLAQTAVHKGQHVQRTRWTELHEGLQNALTELPDQTVQNAMAHRLKDMTETA